MAGVVRTKPTYKLAIPARFTADAVALTAVISWFSKIVRAPLACGHFLCSLMRNLVRVIQSVSIP